MAAGEGDSPELQNLTSLPRGSKLNIPPGMAYPQEPPDQKHFAQCPPLVSLSEDPISLIGELRLASFWTRSLLWDLEAKTPSEPPCLIVTQGHQPKAEARKCAGHGWEPGAGAL